MGYMKGEGEGVGQVTLGERRVGVMEGEREGEAPRRKVTPRTLHSSTEDESERESSPSHGL